jgi:hypothetical protein
MRPESIVRYVIFAFCVRYPGALPQYILAEMEYVFDTLTLQFGARLLLLLAVLATTLFISGLPLVKHARKVWKEYCKARWERDPRTEELKKELQLSVQARQHREMVFAKFKVRAAEHLNGVLAHCVNDGRAMDIPVFMMQCGCMADAHGMHHCRERNGERCRGVLVQEAYVFNSVLAELRAMERWLVAQ